MTGIRDLREKVQDKATVEDVLGEVVAARRSGNDPKELFGGPRDWIDSSVPPAALVLAYTIAKATGTAKPAALRTGIVCAIVAEVLVIGVRLVRKETLRHAFSGAFGVALLAVIVAKTGDARNIALPGILINVAYCLAFVLSVVFRHPLVGVVMRLVSDKPPEYHQHPKVRRTYAELTLFWALSFGLRALAQELLRRNATAIVVLLGKLAVGYPVTIGMLAFSVGYVKWRTRDVPVPDPLPEPVSAEEAAEAESEAGREDAPEHAS